MSKAVLILASSSSSRRKMLASAGVEFTTAMPDVDEDAVKAAYLRGATGSSPGAAVAEALAERKALAISARHPGALIIGADQVLVCEGNVFNKAADESEARATLSALRGRKHELIAAAVIANGDAIIWRCSETAQLEMRDFSDVFLEEYLSSEIPDVLGSVGCYRIEGRGAQLFTRVSGDQFSIRGLPLIPLLEALRRYGVLTP
jgi:septum formation protein